MGLLTQVSTALPNFALEQHTSRHSNTELVCRGVTENKVRLKYHFIPWICKLLAVNVKELSHTSLLLHSAWQECIPLQLKIFHREKQKCSVPSIFFHFFSSIYTSIQGLNQK